MPNQAVAVDAAAISIGVTECAWVSRTMRGGRDCSYGRMGWLCLPGTPTAGKTRCLAVMRTRPRALVVCVTVVAMEDGTHRSGPQGLRREREGGVSLSTKEPMRLERTSCATARDGPLARVSIFVCAAGVSSEKSTTRQNSRTEGRMGELRETKKPAGA
ncbi:uncharacterized protein EI97DRAFT_299654 [Westerdykella ornata]|uniref:Uncharacterized protein n=1 Tax=Westerdykella ornata TaxID=318751 RepID=A0A6A6JM07_WESOR|nr:uncharacterized protein EI97DRAFT_299654 [Westerdykella ornata]KAF2277631.1 hypothetical protein EI97DRAFT_299654 [Westerdykella ornata]